MAKFSARIKGCLTYHSLLETAYYWGNDPNGTSSDYTSVPAYDPPAVSEGAYYLRVKTKDNAGNEASWETLFVFIYATQPGNTAPTINELPDKILNEDGILDNAIDLWSYTADVETEDSGLAFTIIDNTNPDCGVTIDTNRYVDINPTANWHGQGDVTVKVTDPGRAVQFLKKPQKQCRISPRRSNCNPNSNKRGDMMVKSLIDTLSEIPDFRKAKGKRHPLSAILAMSCVAVMCGCRGYRAIAEWGRNYDSEFTKALGFTHEKTPCASTLHAIFSNINVRLVEIKLGKWAESILGSNQEALPEGTSIDGKTLRGSLGQGSSVTHLLSAVSHKLGLTLAQCSVEGKTNEIGTIYEVLQNLVLEGRIFTTDAMHTQRKTCQTIVDGGGDYVTIVKDNQHDLLDDVRTTFHGPFSHMLRKSSDHSIDYGHGRIEERHLTVSDELPNYLDWPEVKQVFMVTRNTSFKKASKKPRSETVYGITSLSPQQADASRLQHLVRCHWHIENRSHWVRDGTFGEDHSQVRCGNIPQVMAAFRNTAIGHMRWLGYENIAAACRYFAAQPWDALEAVGIPR